MRTIPTPLAIALTAIVVGVILLIADVEERVGYLFVVAGLVVAAVVLVLEATKRRRH